MALNLSRDTTDELLQILIGAPYSSINRSILVTALDKLSDAGKKELADELLGSLAERPEQEPQGAPLPYCVCVAPDECDRCRSR